MTIQECYAQMGADYNEVFRRLYNEAMIRKFVRLFPKDDSFHNLEAALKEQNVKEAFRAAHTLKGVCQNLGFSNLYAPAVTAACRPAGRHGRAVCRGRKAVPHYDGRHSGTGLNGTKYSAAPASILEGCGGVFALLQLFSFFVVVEGVHRFTGERVEGDHVEDGHQADAHIA